MKPILLGLAYRMLGTNAEAEDAAQDAFTKWQASDRAAIRNPEAWLTSACTRRCIDLLRAVRRRRAQYLGEWLPEPMFIPEDPNEKQAARLAKSLSCEIRTNSRR
jgi:DNA-directed RNA polymerase specialized sigma24 family protein